jgi:hypothetical protein
LGGRKKNGLDMEEWREIVLKGTPSMLAKSDRYCRGDVREGVRVLRCYAKAIEASGKQLVR